MQQGEARSASGGKLWKVVAGCAIVFGIVVLAGVAGGLYGLYWVFRPGRQMPTSLVVGPKSVGVVRLERGDSDPGIQALAEEAMDTLQRAQVAAEKGTVPPWVQKLREWQLGQSRANLGMWIPREASLSLEPGDGEDETRTVAAVNFHGFVRPMGMLVRQLFKGDHGARAVTHGDEEVLVMSKGSSLCFADGTVLFGSDADALVGALDRWDRWGRANAAEPPLSESVRDLAGRYDVYGALQRPEEARAFLGLVALAWGSGSEERAWDDGLRRVRFAADVRSADQVQAIAELVYDSPESARKAQDAVAGLLSGLERKAEANGLTLKAGPASTQGPEVRIDVDLLGIRAGLRRWSAELARPRRR